MSRAAAGYAFALAGATSFGVGAVIAKGAFAAGLFPSELAELRVLFTFAVLLAIVVAFRAKDLRARRRDLPQIALFGVVGLGAVQWSYYEAIGRLPLGVALTIEYTAPLLILAYARTRGRRVGRRLWLAAALTLLGCALVVGLYDRNLLGLSTSGIAFAVLTAVLVAIYFLSAERILARYTIWTLLVYGFAFALVGWIALRPLGRLPWAAISPATAVLVAGVVIVATVVPFVLTFTALRLIPAARVALTGTAEPLVAALAAWLVFGESLQAPQLLGGALVLVGIGLVQSVRVGTV